MKSKEIIDNDKLNVKVNSILQVKYKYLMNPSSTTTIIPVQQS